MTNMPEYGALGSTTTARVTGSHFRSVLTRGRLMKRTEGEWLASQS